mgnify:CR=1 FL=1
MTDSQNSSPTLGGEPDVEPRQIHPIWEQWKKNSEWRNKLEEKAAYRSLDMPGEAEAVNINSGNTHNHFGDHPARPKPGLGTLAKAGIAAALLASGVGMGAAVPFALSALKDITGGTTIQSDTTTINTEQGPRYTLGLGDPVTE